MRPDLMGGHVAIRTPGPSSKRELGADGRRGRLRTRCSSQHRRASDPRRVGRAARTCGL